MQWWLVQLILLLRVWSECFSSRCNITRMKEMARGEEQQPQNARLGLEHSAAMWCCSRKCGKFLRWQRRTHS